MSVYSIGFRGLIRIDELNLMSPHQMTVVRQEPGFTCVTIETDQAGMIGLLRHLLNSGIHILSISCEVEPFLFDAGEDK